MIRFFVPLHFEKIENLRDSLSSKLVMGLAVLTIIAEAGCATKKQPQPQELSPNSLEQISQTVDEIRKKVNEISIIVKDLGGTVNQGASTVKDVEDISKTIGN